MVGRKPIKLVLRQIFQALGPVSEHRRAVRHDRYQEVRREGLDGVPLQPDDWIRAANSAKPNDAIQERLRLQGLYLCRYLSKSLAPAFRTERYQISKETVILYRSEEHTSELQSLMRISYAVFCSQKKNNITNHS